MGSIDKVQPPNPWIEIVEALIGVSAPVLASIENASVEEPYRLQANRNLPAGSVTMFAKGLLAANIEVACDPLPNAPVEELNGNAVIPSWPVAYKNPVAGCAGGANGLLFLELPHPKSTEAKRTARHVSAAAQQQQV